MLDYGKRPEAVIFQLENPIGAGRQVSAMLVALTIKARFLAFRPYRETW